MNMNKIIISLISVIVIIIAIIIGEIIYEPNSTQAPNIVEKVAEEKIEDDCTEEYVEMQNGMVEANSQEEKISPNAEITLTKYYKNCGHTTNDYSKVSEELVNITQNKLQEKYPDWTIKKFSDTQIVLEKEEDGNCGEHYIVREKDGKVTIYEILEDKSEKEYEETEISTEYLTETDKANIENGIYVNGKKNLNQLIEDFE